MIGTPSDRTITIKNCYSSGDISGTYAGGMVGIHGWNSTAAKASNCYYLLSDTVSNSSGKVSQTMNATGVERLIQEHIDALNAYIYNDPDELGTSDWKKWKLDENGIPSFVE